MAVKVTITFIRPNTGVEWYAQSTEHNEYVKTNFINNGKMIVDSRTESEDGLTRELVHRYPVDADRNDWMNPSLHPSVREQNIASAEYSIANNIKRTVVAEII